MRHTRHSQRKLITFIWEFYRTAIVHFLYPSPNIIKKKKLTLKFYITPIGHFLHPRKTNFSFGILSNTCSPPSSTPHPKKKKKKKKKKATLWVGNFIWTILAPYPTQRNLGSIRFKLLFIFFFPLYSQWNIFQETQIQIEETVIYKI